MARTCSPLRYPGGKSNLFRLVRTILRANDIGRGHYAEPFAGGAGLALMLLYSGEVSEIHLNDIDPAISAFWKSILSHTDEFVAMVENTKVTIEERARQREIYFRSEPKCELELGFAAFFLNRVNRSGIIRTGGVIGGYSQKGQYLIDCRYNVTDLVARIRRVAKYGNRIHFSSLDAKDFLISIDGILPRRSLVYADPPYFKKGAELYTSSFRPGDHKEFRDYLTSISNRWILTYDNVDEIRNIYSGYQQFPFSIYYSAQTKRSGDELLVASDSLRVHEAVGEFGATARRAKNKPLGREYVGEADLGFDSVV